jgi:hypothetical protein
MWLGFGFMLGVIGDGLSFLATISRSSWLSSAAITQIMIGVGLLICSNYFIVKMIKLRIKRGRRALVKASKWRCLPTCGSTVPGAGRLQL